MNTRLNESANRHFLPVALSTPPRNQWPFTPRKRFRLLAVGLLGAVIPVAHAANWAWDTAPTATNFGSANWTSGTSPGAGTGTPATGDSLYFGTSSQLSLTNDLSSYVFGSITFNSGSGAYTLGGNAVTNSAGIANNSTSAQTINFNLLLSGNPIITTTAGGGDLTLGGNFYGPAYSLTVGSAPASGGGTQQGSTTLAGTTNSLAGVTIINGSLSISGPATVPAVTIYQWNKAKNINAYLSVSNGGQLVFSSLAVSVRNSGSHVTPQLTLDNATLKTSASATIGSGLGILINSGGVKVDTTGGNLASSSAFTHGTGTPDGGLILTGGNVFSLPGANNYTGNTIINSGTLALASGATLASTPTIAVAGGATFDVSALSAGFNLGNSQTLSGPGTNTSGVISGNFTFGTTAWLQLNLKPGIAPLQSSAGVVTIGANNQVTINIVNGGQPLGVGSYKLVAAGTGGSVSGTAPTAVNFSGDGIASGTTAALQITGGELFLVISSGSSPSIRSTFSNGNLILNWPVTGWQLQTQTNTLSTGLGTNWVNLTDSTQTTNASIPVTTTTGAVFFRLFHPLP